MISTIDVDWSLGELLHLFERANTCGVYPHLLEPDLFYATWQLLNAQPLEFRKRWHAALLGKITRPLGPLSHNGPRKRYAYVVVN